MTNKTDTMAMDGVDLEVSANNGSVDAKKELARRLMNGEKGVHENEAEAVALLEDCVAFGDAEAMVMLAKCYALAHEIEHNEERAQALISEAAKKGNEEALVLMGLINDWEKDKGHINLLGSYCTITC